MRTPFHWIAMAMLLACVATLPGCDRSNSEDSGDENAQPISHRVEADGVELRMAVSRPEMTLADTTTITIDVVSQESVTSRVIDMTQALPEDWSLVEESHATLRESDGRAVARTIFEVEPFLPGEFEIAPIAVEYGSDAGEGPAGRIETIPVRVTVLSPIDPASGLQGPAEMRSVVDPRKVWEGWWLVGGGVLSFILAIVIGSWIVRRQRRNSQVGLYNYRTAHEIANEALDALEQSGVLERGEYVIVHERLCDILRRYLAHRFDVHAPERTTEEILLEVQRDTRIGEEGVALLTRFLSYCDLVKFAGRDAREEDAKRAFGIVRVFVKQTQSDRPEVIFDGRTGAYVGRLALENQEGQAA